MDDYYKGLLFSLCGNVAINVGHHLRAAGEDRQSVKKPGQKFIHGKIARRKQQQRSCLCFIRRNNDDNNHNTHKLNKHGNSNNNKNGGIIHHTSKNDHNNNNYHSNKNNNHHHYHSHYYYYPYSNNNHDSNCVFCISRKIIFWLVGYALFISGSVSNAYALAFAPQTLLASMGSVQFIVNLFCASFFQQKPIRWVHLFGTLCVVIGCVTLVFGFNPREAADDEGATTIVDLYNNFNRRLYRNYLCVVLIVFIVTIVLSKIQEYLVSQCCSLFNSLCMLANLSSGTSAGSVAAAIQQRAKSNHHSPNGNMNGSSLNGGPMKKHGSGMSSPKMKKNSHSKSMNNHNNNKSNHQNENKNINKNKSNHHNSSENSHQNGSKNGSKKHHDSNKTLNKKKLGTEWHSIWIKISALFYCVGSAMPGSQSVVLGKALAIVVRRTLSGHIAWNSSTSDIGQIVFVCIVAVSWFVTIAFWLYRQNDSTSKFSPELIIPLNQACWILFSTISGGIYFQEFKRASVIQLVSLVLGLILIFAGLFYSVSNLDSPDRDSRLLSDLSRSIKNMDKLPSSHGHRRRGYVKLNRKHSSSLYSSDDDDYYDDRTEVNNHNKIQNHHINEDDNNNKRSSITKRQYLYDVNNHRIMNGHSTEMIELLVSHRSNSHSHESEIGTSSEDILLSTDEATRSNDSLMGYQQNTTSHNNHNTTTNNNSNKNHNNSNKKSTESTLKRKRPLSGSKWLRKMRKRKQQQQQQQAEMENDESSSEETELKFENEREEIRKMEKAEINSSSSLDLEKERIKELAELRAHLERQQKRQIQKLYKKQRMIESTESSESTEETSSSSQSSLSPILSSRNASRIHSHSNVMMDDEEEEKRTQVLLPCQAQQSGEMVVVVDPLPPSLD